MASSEGSSGGESALFSKLGGAFFGGPNSPQKVIGNVRGFLANRLTGAIPDTGMFPYQSKYFYANVTNLKLVFKSRSILHIDKFQ